MNIENMSIEEIKKYLTKRENTTPQQVWMCEDNTFIGIKYKESIIETKKEIDSHMMYIMYLKEQLKELVNLQLQEDEENKNSSYYLRNGLRLRDNEDYC